MPPSQFGFRGAGLWRGVSVHSGSMSDRLTDSGVDDDELHQALLEIRQLRETIDVLREELETQRYRKDRDVQAAFAESADALAQLDAYGATTAVLATAADIATAASGVM